MRLLEKSGTLQILDSLKESSMKEDVSDLVNNEDDVLLGSEEFDGTDPDGVDVSGREPIASFYVGRGNADPGIEIYEIDYNTDDRVLARDLAKLDENEQAHWYTIEYEFEDEDGNELDEGRAFADVDGVKVYMDECIKTNLHEAEETIDIFANPERDYKITDVTMLEPIDDGDVRAIDMQSILIGLDESLTEKYGENWGEFNIQSSRTPRGKIDENDISYVLHVLDINGHQEILNYNTKGTGRIREAFITNYKGKVLESKRCTLNRIPKFFMEATEAYIKKYNEEPITEDAVLPNNGYIDQTGLNLVSDERIQASLKRRVQRLKARQKLLKAKKTFGKDGNVAPVDEKNTHGKEVADSDIGQETEPITDTKIKESVITLDTDTGTVDLDGNVSHVTVDQDGTMTAVSDGEVITATDNSVEVLPSEETMIADDSVLEPNGEDLPAEDINTLEEPEMSENEPEMAPEEAGDTIETDDIAMAEPVPASELEESVEEEESEDTELWCRGKIYWKGNHKDIDENLLLDVADQATEEEGEEIDVDEVDIKKIEESLKEGFDFSKCSDEDLVDEYVKANNDIDKLDDGDFNANLFNFITSNNGGAAKIRAIQDEVEKRGIDWDEFIDKYMAKSRGSLNESNYAEQLWQASTMMGGVGRKRLLSAAKESNSAEEFKEKMLAFGNAQIFNAMSPDDLENLYNKAKEASKNSLEESAEDIDKFWASDIKVGDKITSSGAGEVEVLDLDKGKDYILVKRNTDFQPFVAAWAPQLDDEGKLFWGQGHYFDTEEAARNYMKGLKESYTEAKKNRYYVLRELEKCFEKLENIDYGDREDSERYGDMEPGLKEQDEVIKEFKDIVQKNNITRKEFDEVYELYRDGFDVDFAELIYEPKHASDEDKAKLVNEAVEEKVESDIEGEDTEEVIEEDLVPSTIFHRKCSNTEDMKREEDNKVVTAKSTYVVKDVKEVDEGEFNDLSSNLLKDRDYIKEFADTVEVDNSVAFNCLEVRGPQGSLLIDPSGYGYARYCAFGEGNNIEEPVEEIETEETIEEPVEGEE